jgi:glycosyltransferase involved in cell wall biosynthesis
VSQSSVSVVIPTASGGRWLAESVAQLGHEDVVVEIVLVDDRGPDATPLELESASALRVVRTSGKVGPNRARQLGIECAVGDVILLLDDDVVPSPGLAAGHLAHHVQQRGRVVLGYMPVSPRAAPHRSLPVDLYRNEYEKRIKGYERDSETILTHLWGGNVSIRRVDALSIGLVGTICNGRRHEDREFGLRCRAGGFVGVFDRSLLARHEYERTRVSFLLDARAQGEELVRLQLLHPEAVGEPNLEIFSSGLPAAVRALLRIGRRPRFRRWLAVVVRVILERSERLGAADAELVLLKLARRMEQQAGALEYLAASAAQPRGD